MKRPKMIAGPTLSDSDIEAILCALPLVVEIGSGSPIQDEINANMCASAAQKLVNHSKQLLPNEVRVISASITAAVLLLSGSHSDMLAGIPPERKTELSKYFFTLNRLNPIFEQAIEPFDR